MPRLKNFTDEDVLKKIKMEIATTKSYTFVGDNENLYKVQPIKLIKEYPGVIILSGKMVKTSEKSNKDEHALVLLYESKHQIGQITGTIDIYEPRKKKKFKK